jgi:hypothetical protein
MQIQTWSSQSIYEAKQGSFVLFCHADISQTMALHAVLLVSLESSWQVGGTSTWFKTVWSFDVEAIEFWVDFGARNSNNLQKLGLEGKVSWALNVFTYVYIYLYLYLLKMCSHLGQWHTLH